MSIDESIANKCSEDVTAEDVRGLLNSPPKQEKPLVDLGIFDEQQPTLPIYKSIPLKVALASIVALGVMLPVMRFFSGNLRSAERPVKATVAESVEATETEEEKAQRLTAEENADLKRTLALQNQSFTAQEIEAVSDLEAAAPVQSPQSPQSASPQSSQSQPTAASPTASPRPAPVTRSVSTVARIPAAPPRPTPAARTPVRPATASVRRPVAVAAEPEPVNLAQLAAAGNYGQIPHQPMPLPTAGLSTQLISSANSAPVTTTAVDRTTQGLRSSSIPISVRRQQTASQAIPEATIPEVTEAVERPIPRVMQDSRVRTSTAATVPEPIEISPQADIALKASDTYEAQRDLIMGETALPSTATALPPSIMPGSAAALEVTTAITWASDLPRAVGSVTLTGPLISDGAEIIPQGTELIVQIGALSDSGAVALDVVAMVLPGAAEITALNIPTGAVALLALEGGYPVARAEPSSERQLQAIDRQQALLSAMESAGNYLNRPEQETSIVGIGSAALSREYGDGSILGSLLSGAANGMLRSRAARLDVEADRLMERSTLWSIEPGRQLQLFVTQEISL